VIKFSLRRSRDQSAARVPGLLIRTCAKDCKNLLAKLFNLNVLQMIVKTIFERFYLNLWLVRFVLWVKFSYAPTLPPLNHHYFSIFVNFFRRWALIFWSAPKIWSQDGPRVKRSDLTGPAYSLISRYHGLPRQPHIWLFRSTISIENVKNWTFDTIWDWRTRLENEIGQQPIATPNAIGCIAS